MKLICMLMMCFGALGASEKLYIDIDELVSVDQGFHIHEGQNVWVSSTVIRSEPRGFYVYESDLLTSPQGYEKMWRCPYCNNYWPMGKACGNPNCPSRFK